MARRIEQEAERDRRSSLEQDINAEQEQQHQIPHKSAPMAQSNIFNPYYTGRPRTPTNGSKSTPIDRQSIIRRIKGAASRSTSPELERPHSRSSRRTVEPSESAGPTTPSIDSRPRTPDNQQDHQMLGAQIERPRSALHKGDFREREGSASAFGRFGGIDGQDTQPLPSTSPGAPWRADFPSAAFRRSQQPTPSHDLRPARSRAVSNSSFASSFVYKPPTSPLVQASRPDTPEPPQRRSSRSPDKGRRHTFSPQALQGFGSALEYPASARRTVSSQQPPTLRPERTFPYQAHQPRKSLHSFNSLPQTPAARSRRPSLSDWPLQHAAMVGSYEESILRGRMSTTPSKPLNFVAQIGVLGKGDCRPSLRCPPHATIPFPAVFYSYGSSVRQGSNGDQPSPYVGLVDLENSLPSADATVTRRRQRVQAALSNEGSRASSLDRDGSRSDSQNRLRKRQKQHRRSGSPKAPPGGSYRIPQQGQLQIVIKNPNKSAVKLFLVPYDLSNMQPGQKTFIRQRSYSAGPIIDMPLSSRTNLGTHIPEASLSNGEDPNDRPTLRYLVHLHICCPAKGRFFLYKSIRVVFANRVPDGKEKLRNEIQMPEPRYSAYKPCRDSNVGIAPNAAPSERYRRYSAVEAESTDAPWPSHHSLPQHSRLEHVSGSQLNMSRTYQVAFERKIMPTLDSRPLSRHTSSGGDTDSLPANRPSLDEALTFDRDRNREQWTAQPGLHSESLLSKRLQTFAMEQDAWRESNT